MKSGAQVDINFNEFLYNNRAVWLQDTNQNTTITTNTIVGEVTSARDYLGIYIDTFSADAPVSTRVVIHNNEFTVTSTPQASAIAVYALQTGRVSNISSVITNNQLNLSGSRALGIWSNDVSNGHVSANRFNGDGYTAIGISGMTPVTGWTVTANTGLAAFSSGLGADIWLATATSQCIVGPDQGAAVLDNGTDNTILAQ